MTDHNNTNHTVSNLFNDDFLDDFNFFDKSKRVIDRRAAVRYVRDDINVSIYSVLPISFSHNKTLKLVNINSRGMLLESRHSLTATTGKVFTFCLKFTTGREFKVKGKIVNQTILASIHYEGIKFFYGIKFDHYNNELGEHLLETQSHLIIK